MTSFSNLLKIPTDNLYKFMAFSGIIIFVVSLSFPLYFMNSIEHEKVVFMTEYSKSNDKMIEIDNICNTYFSFLDSLDKTGYVFNPIYFADGDSAIHHLYEINKAMLITGQDILLATQDTINASHAEYDYKNFVENKVLNLCNFGIFLGMILGMIGILFWYNHNQFYNDIILYNKTGNKFKDIEGKAIMRWKKSKKVVAISFVCLYLIFKISFLGIFQNPSGNVTNVDDSKNTHKAAPPIPGL